MHSLYDTSGAEIYTVMTDIPVSSATQRSVLPSSARAWAESIPTIANAEAEKSFSFQSSPLVLTLPDK
ncbi:hypothetical protein [Legionella pneumophila]|uniref:hypothetical protein n=1 Tax=Legionella pneumophila TaxID=446 RepID=UPI0010A9B6FC|nr:hypothetical protein [Legionella pneumophila]